MKTKSFEEIRKIVNGLFDYHAVIDGDPDADDMFYIRLYGVPDDLVIETKKKLRETIKTYWDDGYNLLIPSICSFSATLEHYPEYLKQGDK